jgi:EAL domain-containing protein (putative c-di-GMP-specific phosphodiesterase class I)
MLMPGDFIPVLEQNGFIGKIDYLAWETTGKEASPVDSGGERPPIPISVNLSRIDMFNPKLIDILVGLVHRYEIPARLLQLEVTESIYMDNPELMQKTIKTLKEKGFYHSYG